MSEIDRTGTEWGVMLPNGSVRRNSFSRYATEKDASEANAALRDAGSTETAVVVRRTKMTTYTDWEVTPDE